MPRKFVTVLDSNFILVQVISWLFLVWADSAQLYGRREVENRVGDFLQLDNDLLRWSLLDLVHLLIGVTLNLLLSSNDLSLNVNHIKIFDNFSIYTALNAHLAAFIVRTGLRKPTSYIVISASHYV